MQGNRLDTSLGNAVVRLFRLINRIHNRGLKPTGLSAEQAHVLSVLWFRGPMTMGQLQRQLALSSATLTGAIDRMEAQGLVRRVPSADDRRAFLLEPKASAKKRAQVEAVLDAGELACFGMLTATEREQLLRLIDKCIDRLEPTAAAR
jgi:MarR family transcriptional regulator, organic hydroperoxide resistance regulator